MVDYNDSIWLEACSACSDGCTKSDVSIEDVFEQILRILPSDAGGIDWEKVASRSGLAFRSSLSYNRIADDLREYLEQKALPLVDTVLVCGDGGAEVVLEVQLPYLNQIIEQVWDDLADSIFIVDTVRCPSFIVEVMPTESVYIWSTA